MENVKSGQHEVMLFTVWLNPQIVLITATIHPASSGSKKMIQMNIYVIIAIGNKSIWDTEQLLGT